MEMEAVKQECSSLEGQLASSRSQTDILATEVAEQTSKVLTDIFVGKNIMVVILTVHFAQGFVLEEKTRSGRTRA